MIALLPALLTVLVLALVLVADVARWQVAGHVLQAAADAAALAGAQEVWARREVDASGQVWSEQLYLHETRARQRAQEVLTQNLARAATAVGTLTLSETDIQAGAQARRVRVRVVATPRAYLATAFGILPPTLVRQAEAEPLLSP